MEKLSIFEKFEKLNLKTFSNILESIKEKDLQNAKIIEKALDTMTYEELLSRSNRTIQRKINYAQFIKIQTVDNFDFNYNSSTKKAKQRYLQLIEQDHVKKGVGALFIGSTGLGKTHLSRALGYQACQREYSVLYRTCSKLLNELIAAEETRTLEKIIKKFITPSLLIVDEVGYLDMSHQGANLFFQIISRRHDKNYPTVVTSNKSFSEWNQTFHGDATAHAIVDRLTERSEIFYMQGKSYRQNKNK